jgi:OmpA-OmpF porin, OOP family
MKHIFFVFLLIVFTGNAQAQLLKRLGDRAKNKMEQKAGDKVDKTIDNATDGKSKTETEEVKTNDENNSGAISSAKPQGLKSYSRYDFVPGDKILYAEDFAQDAIGEFPLKWNTNGSGEVVTIEGLPGRWLQFQEATRYESALKNKLPENYTLEFDVLFEFKDDQAVPGVDARLESEKLPGHTYGGKIEFSLQPNNGTSSARDAVHYSSFTKAGDQQLDATKKLVGTWNAVNHKKTPVHVSIWVQKQRFRAWLNQEKVYDLPQGVGEGVSPNHLLFEVASYGGPRENFSYFISNIKIAAATADNRNKLITEGKWSTTGILFDVNSDKIKPTSYGVLKEIAGVLSENADVKVKIIGHTDSDGDDAANLDLSKRRAAAVKNALSSEFNIDASRMETDGMGETKAVGDNKTPEGKAQNRRVEFVKL